LYFVFERNKADLKKLSQVLSEQTSDSSSFLNATSILNYVLKCEFGVERDEVIRGWRQLHDEKLHNLYSSPNIIRMMKSRRMRYAGRVVQMREKRNAYRILVGKPEGKKPRYRWMDNIKVDLREIGWDGMDWIDLTQDRDQWRALVNTVMNIRVP
jgi:hypothetical protein